MNSVSNLTLAAAIFVVHLAPITLIAAVNLAADATVTASSQLNSSYPPENVIDGEISDASRWLSADSPDEKWLILEMPETRELGGAVVYSGWQTGSAVADFRIEQRIEGSWEPILGAEVTGNSSQEVLVRFVEGARTDALRFLFQDDGVARVREIEVLGPEDVPEIEEHPDYVELNRSRYIVKRLNGGKPIITKEMFDALGATDREGGSINGATMVRLPDWLAPEDRADPSARYYLYFAHHGGHYIRMAWSEKPTGPFTLYRVGSHIPVGTRGVLDMGEDRLIEAAEHYGFKLHIASPEVLVDDENRRFVMYFHGVGDGGVAGQYSMPAVSDAGLDFSDGLQPCAAGISYFRVFHVHGQAYAFANACKTFRAPEGTRATDDLAINPPEDHPIGFYWDWLKEFREEKIEGIWAEKLGITDPEGNIRHHSLLKVDENRFQLFYTVKEANPPERIFMTEFDATDPDWRDWTFSAAEEIMRPRLDWEGVNRPIKVSRSGGGSGHELRDPYIFRDDDGTLYLYYSGQGEDAIGVAQLIPRTYSLWQEEQDWPDGADQGMLEDSDSDGACNLLEYALGLNVRLPDVEKLPDFTLIQAEDGPWWSFTFRRSHLPTDLDYSVRQSGNLAGWTNLPVDGVDVKRRILSENIDGDGIAELVEIRVRDSPLVNNLFLRLKVAVAGDDVL
jgi:hypothetical protein